MNKQNDEPCYVMKKEQVSKSEQLIENLNSKTDLPFVAAVTEVVKGDAKDSYESGFVTCGPLVPGRYSPSSYGHIQYFDNSKYFQIDKNIFQFCILANFSKKKILRVFSSVGVKNIIVRRPSLGEAVNAASINVAFEYLRHHMWVIECKKAESKKLEKWGKELFVWTSEKIQNKVSGRIPK